MAKVHGVFCLNLVFCTNLHPLPTIPKLSTRMIGSRQQHVFIYRYTAKLRNFKDSEDDGVSLSSRTQSYRKLTSEISDTDYNVIHIQKQFSDLKERIPYLFYDIYAKNVEMRFFTLYMENIVQNTSSADCIIPDYDPKDPSVMKYFEIVNPIICGENQPYLTYIDSEGYIHLNKTAIDLSGLTENDYDCSYSEILRPKENDGDVEFGQPQVFRESEKIQASFILVKCYLRKSRDLVYENLHFYVSRPTGSLHKSSRRSIDGDIDRPSVLIFTIDSMSRLNFIRQLPKTYKVLTTIINATIFKGMTKTGDNTFPNMIPFLTGRKLERAMYYDDFPIAWKNFSANGYVTMFNEDFPYLSLFNYLAYGFKKPPTDYYAHPLWLATEIINSYRSRDWRCFSNTPKHVIFLDYVKQFVATMKDHRYFAISFITGLSHEDLNLVQVGDDDFADAFFKMWTEGHLDNTVLLVLGDHGNRFSALRRTHIGRVESNMPFFAVRLPDVFKQKFPHLDTGLQRNSNKLLSWYINKYFESRAYIKLNDIKIYFTIQFDFYEMLMDLAYRNLGETSLLKRYGTVGSSPFRQIPSNRTCNDAGIPEEYCICTRETQLPTNDSRVKAMAQDLLSHINDVLLESTIDEGLCCRLELTNILSAELLSLGPQVAKPRDFRVLYRVTIQVSPSDGVFEGTLELDAWSVKGRTVGDVNRLNLYGKQSQCVHDNTLRLYCFCTDLMKTLAF
ncbi:hypothetical protein C0J52_00457 [Blattella germanica]|nr:hypothetical protein C0J52_00457 [Blattella germanica]